MKRKHFYSVQEYANERHFSPRQVLRLCVAGKISCFREGRKWVILADQTKKASIQRLPTAGGLTVEIPPIAPDGLFWDIKRKRLIPIEEFAKKNGLRVVRKGSRRLLEFKITVAEKTEGYIMEKVDKLK